MSSVTNTVRVSSQRSPDIKDVYEENIYRRSDAVYKSSLLATHTLHGRFIYFEYTQWGKVG